MMWISKVIVLYMTIWAGLWMIFIGGSSIRLMVTTLLMGLVIAEGFLLYSLKPSYHLRLKNFTYVFFLLFIAAVVWHIMGILGFL